MAVILFLLSLTIVAQVTSGTDITVKTKLGLIKGISSSFTFNNITKDYKEFRNIPFAKPPVGHLRFRRPIAYGPWNGILDATRYGPSCMQKLEASFSSMLPNGNISEDCLVLNIYAPSNASPTNTKPVIIWIHGGGYYLGQGMYYDGSYLSGIGDVVVVTINYRLGVFGFFSTGDGIAPGNYGLWDQKLSIEWVRDNIASFGGDSNSITLAGQSAGGFSVALQALHSANRGLFHRIIAESGVSNSIIATTDTARSTAKIIANLLNCSIDLTSESVKCMRDKTSKELLDAFLSLPTGNQSSLDIHVVLDMAPVVDGVFLEDKPENILNSHSSASLDFFKSLDVIIGSCESEGAFLPYSSILPKQKYLSFNVSDGIPSEFLCKHVVPPLVEDYFNNNTLLIPDICRMYSSNGSIQQGGVNGVNLMGDVIFYYPAVESLNIHAIGNQKTKQFQYMFKRLSMYFERIHSVLPWYHGAGHGAEMYFLFPSKYTVHNFTIEDKSVGVMLMKYWSNFAKTGYDV